MEQAELQPLYDSYHRKIAKIDLHNVGYPKQGDFLVDDKHPVKAMMQKVNPFDDLLQFMMN